MDLVEENMKKLLEQAKKLGIKFDDDIEEDALKKLIEEKEKEIEKQNNDVDFIKKELEKYKTEASKAFEKRDAIKADKAKLTEKVKDLEGKMKSMIDAETFEELKKEFDDLKTFKSDFDKKKEEEKLNKLDEMERLKLEKNKELEKFQKEMEDLRESFNKEKEDKENKLKEAQTRISKLRKSTLGVDIMKAAVKNKAWNPDQIVRLLRDDLTYDDTLDKYSYIKRDEKGKVLDELSVGEYVTEFLKKEENENLIKSDVNTSTFHSDKTKPDEKGHKGKSKYDPKDPEIVRIADERDMSVERYIKTLEIRDKAMEEVNANKE